MATPIVYRNVESVLNVLHNHKQDNKHAVTSLIHIYDNALSQFKEKTHEKASKQHPFIVLEGLDGCGKSTSVNQFASKFGVWKWCTPPKSIKHIRHWFDDHPKLRSAYYALGNYIAALEVGVILSRRPIVMDRYWHSTAAFAIAQAVHDNPDVVEMPPEGDSFYNWPGDLLKPDKVLFLEVSEVVRIKRLARRTESTTQENLLKASKLFRDNIRFAYKNMVNPNVVFINADSTIQDTVQEIVNNVQHLFLA